MKRIFTLILSLFFVFAMQAEVAKTLTGVTAGSLFSSLTEIERNTVTSLTLTGVIDGRDFVTMRDTMPVLEFIDLSGVSITSADYPDGGEIVHGGSNDIPSGAFEYMTSLKTLVLPSYIEMIGNHAFMGCTNLSGTFVIPSTITSIGSSVFKECSSLITVVIPSTVTEIHGYAFFGCTSLTSIDIPSSVKYIGNSVFDGCTSLVTATVPNSITSMGKSMFRKCSSLTSVSIPDSIAILPSSTFKDCRSLTGTIVVPSNIKSIDDYAFEGCTGIENFVLPSKLTSIGISSFEECSSLTSIRIPDSVATIATYAFNKCSGLTSVFLSDSLISIGESVFMDCENLETFVALNRAPIDLSSSPTVFYNVKTDTCVLYVPRGSVDAYRASNQWQDFFYIKEIVSFDSQISAVKSNGGTVAVDMESDFEWTVNLDQNWIHVTPSTGTGSTVLVFSVDSNKTGSIREAVIKISSKDLNDEAFVISQKALPVVTINAPTEFVYGTVLADSLFTVEASVAGSFVYNPALGTKLEVGNAQSIEVKFIPTNTIDFDTLVKTVVIDVLEAKASVGDVTDINLDKVTLVDSLDVTSNTTWVITIDASWLTASPTTYSGNGKVIFTAEPNMTGAERTAKVTLSLEGADDIIINVTQADALPNGVNEDAALSISIWPNPATTQFVISGFEGTAKLSIIDIAGKVVVSEQVTSNNAIDVSSLPVGVYTVVVTTANGVLQTKLMK